MNAKPLRIMSSQGGMAALEPVHAARRISFVTEDGREAFEVRPGKDGRSIEIRAVECFHADGVLYSNRILIAPNVSNSITVSAEQYE